MAKKPSHSRKLNVYSNLAHKRKTKKDMDARKRAEYLASLPKHPIKRFFYQLHPKRALKYWFSKRGLFMGLKIFGVCVLLSVLFVGGLFAYYRKDLDQIRPEELAKRVQTTVSKYYDRNGELLWEDKGEGNYKLVVESDEISKYLKTCKNVNAAYLRLMVKDNEQSYLIVVDFSGDKNEIFSGIANAGVPFSNGKYLDFVSLSSDFGKSAVEKVESFYKKKKFGIF